MASTPIIAPYYLSGGTFEEEYRANNWRFAAYRSGGYSEPDPDDIGRSEYMGYPFPAPGAPRPQDVEADLWEPQQIFRPSRALSEEVRDRFEDADEYFTTEYNNFRFIRPLGYGGLGLTIHLKYNPDGSSMVDRDVVLKIALNGWVDETLRVEEAMTRKMARAAHCIQVINPADVGIWGRKRYRYNMPDPFDSSDDGASSSGSESREDERVDQDPWRRTRRWQMQFTPHMVNAKHRRHVERLRTMSELWRQRNEAAKDLEDMPESDPRYDLWDFGHKDFLLLEFMENGDLGGLLAKIAGQKDQVRIPNRVLWSFWLCLVKACVAMDYPPRKFHPRRHENRGGSAGANTSSKVRGDELFEEMPKPSRRYARKRLAHFDIDPRNIFIGGFDFDTLDGEHQIIPRLKLADFGLANSAKRHKSNEFYLEKRRLAKEGYFAPEQFGVDWDHIAPTNKYGWELSEQPIAGNYEAINVWGIALSMWQTMTLVEVPLPPQPQTSRPGEPLHYCPLLTTDPSYSWIDEELRETIVQCMRHDPRERPDLNTLLEQATRGAQKVFENETDEDIRRWVVNSIFHAPTNSPTSSQTSSLTSSMSSG